jgi:hypothetical protein
MGAFSTGYTLLCEIDNFSKEHTTQTMNLEKTWNFELVLK